jgi:prolipoprotein diacylglyceryltransferase
VTFRRCGYVGVATAAGLALWLAWRLGLSLMLEGALILTACACFLGLAAVTRRVARRERLVYYHHEILVLSVVGLVTWVAGGPVLAHLDATALGLGAFLAWGRIGCLKAGCCHGRPARHGITYGPEFAERGFTRHLIGVPLVPVQAIEAALVAAIVVAASLLVLDGQPAGTGIALYVAGYAVVRFALEFLRGDPLRPYWRGLSEAQWTSVLVAALVAVGAVAGVLPQHWWDEAAAALLSVVAAALALSTRPPGILDPRHVQEVVRAVAAARPEPLEVVTTSAGVQLSCGRTEDQLHVAISADGAPLSASEAGALAHLIGGLRSHADVHFVAGAGGVWHVLLRG